MSRPGSETLSVASPVVLITFAAVCAVYSLATPGVNGPNDALPTDSDSVAGTVPPTPPSDQASAARLNGTSRTGPSSP